MVAAEGDLQGGGRIVDLHNGLYEVFYTAPTAGAYLVHVEYADAGVNPVPVGIRGSPFAIECTDPWTKHRVLGALPARRQVRQACRPQLKMFFPLKKRSYACTADIYKSVHALMYI